MAAYPYQSAYPTSRQPAPIGFENIPDNSYGGGYPGRVAAYPPPSAVHYQPPVSVNDFGNSAEVTPDVGFEGYVPKKRASKDPVQSTSGVELENVEVYPEDVPARSDRPETAERRESSCPKPLYFRDGRKRIDYVLTYQEYSDKTTEWQEKRADKRKHFQESLEEQGLELEQEDCDASQDAKTYYVKVHAPWDVLARGAEEMMMKMPTIKNDTVTRGMVDKLFGCLGANNPFEISEEEVTHEVTCNYFTCRFERSKIENFKGKDNKDTFFTNSQRSEIVYRIMKTTVYDPVEGKMGVERLLSNSSYDAVFPLHEGHYKYNHGDGQQTERQTLYNVWAKFRRFYKKQPLNLIRKYFGEKIGIYFAWIGFYTILLFPAAIFGLINVIYGLAKLSDYTPANIICDKSLKNNYTMCPRCDKCDYFPLYDTCEYARVAYVFDNEVTVVFAVFMSLWSTMFLEFWKRRQVEIAYEWDLLGFEDEEENVRPEYENACTKLHTNPITQVQEPHYPSTKKCPRFVGSGASVLLMICLVIAAVFGVVVYRVAVFASLSAAYDGNISTISLTVTATAAVINLIIILLLGKVYEKLAYFLTDQELPRTQTNYDDSFTIKMYLFQFVNYYSSLFYIGFGKLNPGRPGDYHRIFGFRKEECNAAGCLVELTVQLAIIMVGKQIVNALMEIVVPKLTNWWKRRGNIIKKFRGEETIEDQGPPTSQLQWQSDDCLTPIPRNALFYEYLEMVIQFGFITIFVAAFPLGPFFALLNNLVEIRLDAYKFITTYRRPRAARAEDIGIWYSILKGVVIFSVVVNGFVIAFVSEFVPRLYFKWSKGKDGDLEGYLDTSLSCFDTRNFPNDEKTKTNFTPNYLSNGCGLQLPSCRYRGYRDPPMKYSLNPNGNLTNVYDFSKDYWHILSGQLFFVIAFLLVVFGLTALLGYVIPDRPKKLDNLIKREAFLAKDILRADRGKLLES